MKISVTFQPDSGLEPKQHGGHHPSPDAVCNVSRASTAVPDSIEVEFVVDAPDQQSGKFSISPEVARWLAGALLAAADKHTDKVMEIRIEGDAICKSPETEEAEVSSYRS